MSNGIQASDGILMMPLTSQGLRMEPGRKKYKQRHLLRFFLIGDRYENFQQKLINCLDRASPMQARVLVRYSRSTLIPLFTTERGCNEK